jgi:putative transposase
MPAPDIGRKAGISQATCCTWKKKYAGLTPCGMRRLKQLEDESSRLNRIVADHSLDNEMLQGEAVQEIDPGDRLLAELPAEDLMPGRKRQHVEEAHTDWKVSISRACDVAGFEQSTCHYRSVPPDQASLRRRIREIAETCVRFGYRRIHIRLCR